MNTEWACTQRSWRSRAPLRAEEALGATRGKARGPAGNPSEVAAIKQRAALQPALPVAEPERGAKAE
jgi:hypothetical protein